jgi:catechol 2,3-dioxygenase-like lactoylglutathione lyase family enzyme
MRFVHVTLQAPSARLPALMEFYGDRLGLRGDAFRVAVGETALELAGGIGEPFYHFAFLVPGNRFAAALEWARERVELLPYPASGEVVFDFDNWDALACYFHDPAGNIVELIAHRGVEETVADGEFGSAELVGLSELGLVGDPAAMAALLSEQLGITLWDGTTREDSALAFVGEKARTLILVPPGRGWLPTGRRAEPHAVAAAMSGAPRTEVRLEDGRYRLSGVD